MLALRKYPLPHDLQYLLDGAADARGITSAADIAIRLYADSDTFESIWNEGRPAERGRNWQDYLYNRQLAMERYGASLIQQMPEGRQMALMQFGFHSLILAVKNKADWLAGCNYEDETKGGCLKHFRRKDQLGRDGLPTRKLARRLRSRKRIARYVAGERDIQHTHRLFEVLSSVIPKCDPANDGRLDAERDALIADLNGQMEAARVKTRETVEYQRYFAELAANERNAAAGRILARRDQKDFRKAAKRAAIFAAALLGASTVSAFARGQPVSITGQSELGLEVQLGTTILGGGHGALRVIVHAPDGQRLANLCVYQDAPALDQLVALALHMQAEGIEPILSSGNLFAVEPAANEWPQLVVRKAPVEGRRPWIDWRDPTREQFEAGRNAYVAEMLPVYMEAIASVVFGPAVSYWRRNGLAVLAADERR